jgi:cytochrome c oxidase subunit 2
MIPAVFERTFSVRRLLSAASWLALAPGSAAGPAEPTGGTNVFAPLSSHAEEIHRYSLFVLGITGAIFLVVFTLLAVAVVRFRRRPGDDDAEPPQIYGSRQVEVAWTVIPVLIVIVLGLTTARTIFQIQDRPTPPGALEVTVVGRQWWWELRYPSLGIVTANELHVPVSDPARPAPTFLTLLSADVAHSFWVPRLAGKTDLIPNKVNRTWIDPRRPGLYVGQCAEFCGTQHAKMLLRVYVHTPEDFDRWVESQKAVPDAAVGSVSEGRRVFETTACLNCHTVRGTVGDGRYGPDLTHLMSRETIASGAVPNTPETLKAWIQDPSHFKPGVLMPAMQLDGARLDALVGYLQTLR